MKIADIVIVENVNDVVMQEIEDKIGPVGNRRPGWENVDTPRVVQKAKGLYTTGGPSMTPGLAVDLAIEEIHPELKDRMKSEFGFKRSTPGVDPDKMKSSSTKDTDDGSRSRKDAIGRSLKHDRYYGTTVTAEPEPKVKKDKVGIAKRFKDMGPLRKLKSPGKVAKATIDTIDDISNVVKKVRDLAPQTKKSFNFTRKGK
tara:strand:+ start:85 stop:684 length:600 start_codon:yes stop_codon:yes gene_type:complete